MLWMNEASLDIVTFFKHHIDVIVKLSDIVSWRLIGFYDFLKHSLKHRYWDLLCILRNRSSLLWLCCGDFN